MSTTNPMRDEIQKAISEHEVILFMKGRPEQPMCGFSARTVAALDALGATYAAVDILPDPRIRQELSAISNWPTIPQLFVKGDLVGGCDIVSEMYESGELAADARDRAAHERPRGGAGRRRAGRPAPPDPQRPRLTQLLATAAMALAVAVTGDNEQPARRTEPKLVTAAGIEAAQRFAATRPGQVAFAVMTEDGRLRGINVDAQFRSASMTKAMLLVAVLRRAPRARSAAARRRCWGR